MLKRSTAILSIVLGMMIFLLGCSKANHDTLAFVGDESDMKTCYQIYPEQYFPNEISQELREGHFPPDLVGEYEIKAHLVDASVNAYYPLNHMTVPIPQVDETSLYLTVTDQVNGMAKIAIDITNITSTERYEADAYIYGDVYSDNGQKFMLCYETAEDKENTPYKIYIGNIITGTLDQGGIKDVDYWYVFKKVTVSSEYTPYPLEGSYVHYHAD